MAKKNTKRRRGLFAGRSAMNKMGGARFRGGWGVPGAVEVADGGGGVEADELHVVEVQLVRRARVAYLCLYLWSTVARVRDGEWTYFTSASVRVQVRCRRCWLGETLVGDGLGGSRGEVSGGGGSDGGDGGDEPMFGSGGEGCTREGWGVDV